MSEPRTRRLAPLLVLLAFALAPASPAQETEPGAPYVPTPMNVVTEMLELAAPSPEDTVYDLGSGDGRLPVAAARLYGAHGVGVELDSALVARSRRRARRAGVDSLVRFVRGDLFETDLRPATVVTLYLFPEMNERLRPRLFRQMEPGARVVSHDFGMGDWAADSVIRVPEESPALEPSGPLEEGPEGLAGPRVDVDSLVPDPGRIELGATVYLWVIPADAGGTWELRLPDGRTARLRIDQRFQQLRAEAVSGVASGATARIRADTVRLTLESGEGETVRLTGTVDGRRMEGRAPGGDRWTARRTEDTDASVLEWRDEPGNGG